MKPSSHTSLIPDEWEFYAYCPTCNSSDKVANFAVQASSLSDAREKLEAHEKECHKGKQIGTFGHHFIWKLPSYKEWETYFRELTGQGMDCLKAWHETNKHFGMPYKEEMVNHV